MTVRAHQHRTYVQGPVASGPDRGLYFGVCSMCSWMQLRNVLLREEAELAAQAHHDESGIEARLCHCFIHDQNGVP